MSLQKAYISAFLCSLLLCVAQLLYAQDEDDPTRSNGGRFSVNAIKGCPGMEVFISHNHTDPGTKWNYYYYVDEDTNGPIPDQEIMILEKPGTYYIIEATQNAEPVNDSIMVQVIDPEPPYVEISNCGNNTLWVSAPEGNTTYDFYRVNDDPALELNQENNFELSVPFASSGNQQLTIEGMLEGPGVDLSNCSNIVDTTVMVHSTIEPGNISAIRASIPNQEVTITYDVQPNVTQVLEMDINGDGNFSPQQELTGNEVTLSLNPESEYYCFRIRTHNRCTDESNYSETICTSLLSGTTSLMGTELEFSTSPEGSPQASLQRDGQEIHSFGSVAQGSFTDAQSSCNTAYNYSLTLQYSNATSITEGLVIQNENSGELATPENIASVWTESDINFQLIVDNPPSSAIYKAYRANASNLVNESETDIIPLPAAGESSCYRFTYSDACGSESDFSETVCALYLQNTATQPDELSLVWNEYTGYADGVRNYVVEQYDVAGNFQNSYPVGLQTSLDLGTQDLSESGYFYRVTAFPADPSLPESSSNLFEFRITMKGYFPTAFSPNGDGRNDTFKVEGKFVESCRLRIFNSWGEQIFESNDITNGWDGTKNGRPVPQGNYVYRAEVVTTDEQQHLLQGSVFLLRK